MRIRTVGLLGMMCAVLVLFSGCWLRVDAIAVSQTTLDIGLNTLPQNIEVWNVNDNFNTLSIDAETSDPWIIADPIHVESDAPGAGDYDKQRIVVRIDRTQLTKGSHQGWIEFSASRVFPVRVTVKVQQAEDGSGVGDELNIVNPQFTYAAPYLLDFSFALRDKDGNPVVAEPTQFEVSASENGEPIEDYETGVHLKKSVARQLKIDLLLDYSASMQDGASPGAIAAMENAVINVLLPALNADAQVGVIEFHVESSPPQRVAELTTNHDYVADRIFTIQDDYVNGFFGGSRALDAVVMSSDGFPEYDPLKEERYIVLLSDGMDTSSSVTVDEAIDAALDAGAHIYTIGFGAQVNDDDLLYMAEATGGDYYPADSVNDFGTSFQQIVDDLGGQYTLRWATLRRFNNAFLPSFTITLNQHSATYTGTEEFVPSEHAGAPGQQLQGALRLVGSDDPESSTIFLRADYVPRQINELHLYVESAFAFNASLVEAGDDGLLAAWNLQVENAEGGKWITITSPGDSIPFATFGPMLRFDFQGVPTGGATLISDIYVDNDVYANDQSFVVQGFDNTAP